MANPEHLAKIREGVEAWNGWRNAKPETVPDLTEAKLITEKVISATLSGVNLRGALLERADLNGARLGGANLFGADLTRADLAWADLSGANLRHANLSNADLNNATLISATLLGTRFAGALLRDADLTGAFIGSTTFGDNDLGCVKGLETVHHLDSSIIGIDTILLSKGKVPESFLRGCGVPESFITYIPSLVASAKPYEFYSCFISYSTKDQAFADRLYADLQNKGVRCWFAPHDIQGGRKLHEQIDEAIRLHDKLLLILSPHSMESEWVKTEIAKACKREVRDQRRALFPIRLAPFEALRDWECFDADTGKDSAREIREYFIPDFSNWKNHDSYQEAFKRLISDLKASDATRPPATQPTHPK
jgi:hypothetical protein